MSDTASWDPGAVKDNGKLKRILKLIRVEHTLFSLPFAYAGAILSNYPFTWKETLLIATALLGLRSSAMSYNNIVDLPIDKLNPRSARRPLVTGSLTIREAYYIVVAGSILYFLSAALLNKYALLFSPLLWVLAHTYPYAKRYHSYPHYHLGLVLGFAVFGGSVAVTGSIEGLSWIDVLRSVPWIYVIAVTLWVAGFDIYYSVLDYEFDKMHGIGSVPARYGKRLGMVIGLVTHLAAISLLLLSIVLMWGIVKWSTLASTLVASCIMLYGDVKSLLDERYIPKAFNQNLLVGLLISGGIIIDYVLFH